MSRVIGLALGCMVAIASVPAEARTPVAAATKTKSKSKPTTAKAKAKARADAKQKAAKQKRGKRVAVGKAGKRVAVGKAGKRVAVGMGSKRRPRIKTTSKPLVKVAALQADGRVRYGADRMPPGFAWPPTTEMRAASKSCEDALEALGVEWKPAAVEGMVVDPIVVPSMEIGGIKYTSIYKRAPHTLDCQFAHTLALIGPELYALGVREVQFGSIFRDTMARSHGQTKTFKSRHALGIAMDIKSFVDDAGRVAVVEMDYLKGDPLLHAVEDAINRNTRFRQVLTPGNDPISHDDHFHIEASVDFTAFR